MLWLVRAAELTTFGLLVGVRLVGLTKLKRVFAVLVVRLLGLVCLVGLVGRDDQKHAAPVRVLVRLAVLALFGLLTLHMIGGAVLSGIFMVPVRWATRLHLGSRCYSQLGCLVTRCGCKAPIG